MSEVSKYIRRDCGNPGRSGHRLAARAAEAVYLAREEIASFFGCENPERVIFTSNATHALNLAIKSQIRANCHVLCSDIEHNSVVRPLERLRRDIGIEYSCFSLDGDLYANLTEAVRADTEAIVCTLASNVTGKRADVKTLSRFAKERGLKLILDASQLAGHEAIDLSVTPCTALCAPGHKGLFGLQGSGFVIFDDDYDTDGLMEGGSGFDSVSADMPHALPERYEAGTLPTPAIAGLCEGIRAVKRIGVENIHEYTCYLTSVLRERLSQIERVRLYAPHHNGAVLLFNIDGISADRVGEMLDAQGICVRTGYHCSALGHATLQTPVGGAVRVSAGFFNAQAEMERTADVIKAICSRA